MASTREIVTKAVVGKGKKTFSTTKTVTPTEKPDTILGCWVINHNFKGIRNGNKINIEGSYDINIWYSCGSDTKTEVIKDTTKYLEEVSIPTTQEDDVINEDVIIRSLNGPTCVRCDVIDGKIEYTVEKEMGVEIVGDVKVKIAYESDEDPWDNLNDLKEEKEAIDEVEEKIDNEVNEEYLN